MSQWTYMNQPTAMIFPDSFSLHRFLVNVCIIIIYTNPYISLRSNVGYNFI